MVTSLNVKRASSSAVRLSRQRGKPTWRNSADREMPKVVAAGKSSLRNDCRSAKTHRPGERHGSLYLDRFVSALIAVSMIPLRRFRVAVASLSNRIQVRPLFASKNDPSDGAETGVAEPHVAEQSRSWRAASGEQEVMRGS